VNQGVPVGANRGLVETTRRAMLTMRSFTARGRVSRVIRLARAVPCGCGYYGAQPSMLLQDVGAMGATEPLPRAEWKA
jgi:hypothetical protein